jgi:hypothetical protein
VGYGIGPLFLAPITEIPQIGRNLPYIVPLAIFCILQIPTALVDNFAGFCILRFIAGFVSSPPLATGGESLPPPLLLFFSSSSSLSSSSAPPSPSLLLLLLLHLHNLFVPHGAKAIPNSIPGSHRRLQLFRSAQSARANTRRIPIRYLLPPKNNLLHGSIRSSMRSRPYVGAYRCWIRCCG